MDDPGPSAIRQVQLMWYCRIGSGQLVVCATMGMMYVFLQLIHGGAGHQGAAVDMWVLSLILWTTCLINNPHHVYCMCSCS